MIVYKLGHEQIKTCWPGMRPLLLAALQKFGHDQRYPLDQLLLDLLTNENYQSWLIVNKRTGILCACVTEINEYPLGKAVNIFLVGGSDMEVWGDLLHDALTTYAKEIGARWLDTGSRRGIGKRFYDRLGYTRKQENYCFEVATNE